MKSMLLHLCKAFYDIKFDMAVPLGLWLFEDNGWQCADVSLVSFQPYTKSYLLMWYPDIRFQDIIL